MGLGITNILIVSKYETKLLVRGWFFKVFAFLALFAAVIIGSIYILSPNQQAQMVNRSVIPYMFMLVMNLGQAVEMVQKMDGLPVKVVQAASQINRSLEQGRLFSNALADCEAIHFTPDYIVFIAG